MARPSTLRVAADVSGVEENSWLFKQMQARMRDSVILMEELTEYLADISHERVRRGEYAPLTSGTVERKSAQGEDTGIFRDEWRPIKGTPTRKGDALWRALTDDGPGVLRRATPTMAVFGVQSAGNGPLFYARFVQNVKGTQRRILAITPAQAATIAVKTMAWITSGSTSYRRTRK